MNSLVVVTTALTLLCLCSAVTINNPQFAFGTIKTIEIDNKVKIHNYEGGVPILVNSYIIELPNKLVIIDPQFVLPAARELLEHAKRLNKPIDRVIVTHAHPDHYLGLEVFKSVAPIHGLLDTIIEIGKEAQFAILRYKQSLQDLIPSIATLPNRIQREGPEVIDGILFNFLKVQKTDAENTLIVVLPFQRSMFVGDAVYNQIHFYLAEKHFDNWINVLKGFQRDFLFYNIFQGHGTPTTTLSLQENINYLEFVKVSYVTSSNYETFKSKMVNKYPNYRLDTLLDLSSSSLYPTKISY